MKKTGIYKTDKRKVKEEELKLVNAHAAGIDIGSGEHWVSVHSSFCDNNIRKFGVYTSDLLEIADWLKECEVTSVIMESTGIYWIPLYEVLESKGFQLNLCNAKHAKNVPGRKKTDLIDCDWLRKLHSYGMLSASFIPTKNIREVKVLMRHRGKLVQQSSRHIQHMQKSLTLMNFYLQKVVTDITGLTGMKIIKSIISGEIDPKKLVKHRHKRIKKSKEEMIKALEGNIQFEQMFILKQAVESYEFILKQIEDIDSAIDDLLSQMDKQEDNTKNPVIKKKALHTINK